MRQTVTIRNISGYALDIGTYTIGAYGKLVLPYPDWASLASSISLSAYSDSIVIDDNCGAASIDVISFGAHGDGFTDDTLAFSDAIEYLSGVGGGTINIDSGIYIVDTLSVTSPVLFKGEGASTIIKQTGDSIFTFDSAGTCGISDMMIISTATPLIFNSCYDGEITDCAIVRKTSEQYIAAVSGGNLTCYGNIYTHVGTSSEYRYNLSNGAKAYEQSAIERAV